MTLQQHDEAITKTPQQILDQLREEFENLNNDGYFMNKYGQPHSPNILSFLTSTLRAFVEAEIEILERMKKETSVHIKRNYTLHSPGTMHERYIETGKQEEKCLEYNQALQDQISHLKELLVTKR